MRQRLRLWVPVAAQMIVIFSLSSMSHPPMPVGGMSSVWGHFGMFGILSALFVRALRADRESTRGVFIRAVLFTLLYGIFDEAHQAFVPDRTPDVFDVLTDAAGAAAAAGALWAWGIIRPDSGHIVDGLRKPAC